MIKSQRRTSSIPSCSSEGSFIMKSKILRVNIVIISVPANINYLSPDIRNMNIVIVCQPKRQMTEEYHEYNICQR